MMSYSRVFIVVNEEREKEREKEKERIDIKDMYFEILNLLIEYYDYDYDSDKRGKMTMSKRDKTCHEKK
jgi:hypothetical protein